MIRAYLYGALAAVVLGLGVTTYISIKSAQHARAELVKYQASAAAVIAERIAAQEAERAKFERKQQEIISAYTNRQAAFRAELAATAAERDIVARRLRDALANPAPAVPAVDADPSAAAGGGRDRLLEELARCVRNTDRLRAVRDLELAR